MVEFLVNKCGSNIEHREIQDRSPLYYSASKGNIPITKFFVSKGADVNARTAMVRCALLKAVWNGQSELVKVLLEYPNIDVTVEDGSGRTPLHMAAWG